MNDALGETYKRAFHDLTTPRPASEYHEDMGPVLWWCREPPKPFEQVSEHVVSSAHNGQWLGEAPWCGTPNDLGQEVLIETRSYTMQDGYSVEVDPYHGKPEQRINVGGWPGYHTHWTPLPRVVAP